MNSSMFNYCVIVYTCHHNFVVKRGAHHHHPWCWQWCRVGPGGGSVDQYLGARQIFCRVPAAGDKVDLQIINIRYLS